MQVWLSTYWPIAAAVVNIGVAGIASAHVVLHKRDPRAAIAWVGLIWLTPMIGAGLYYLLGINRIQRRATLLKKQKPQLPLAAASAVPSQTSDTARACGTQGEHLLDLMRAADRIVRRPLLAGNDIEPLENGDAAYPAMLDAIAKAKRSVALSTYIFDNDTIGKTFVTALADAAKRGVCVRVLVDAVGARYSWPSVVGRLRKSGVTVAAFLPSLAPFATPFINLRNHRKILVIDGSQAFTGGMNIRHGHFLRETPLQPVRDLHFRLVGPIAAQLLDCFAEDWAFATKEILVGDAWSVDLEPRGTLPARAISDGPDIDFEVLRHMILSALASARRSVRIMTPYFVPDQGILTCLNVAALRGVKVDIVIPERGNIRLAQWASTAMLWQVLQHGCHVHLVPPPFDHTKLMVVDDTWMMFGSANWDARSLRLNFELNVECYSAALAVQMGKFVDQRIAIAKPIYLADVDARPLAIRLRDGAARLFVPYL